MAKTPKEITKRSPSRRNSTIQDRRRVNISKGRKSLPLTEVHEISLPYDLSLMQLTLIVSTVIHVIMLSIHFEPELRKFKDSLPVLEVNLVNTKTNTEPKKADTFAQANLDRGGNTDQDRKMKSVLPTPTDTQNTVITASLTRKSAATSNSNPPSEELTESEIKRLKDLERKAERLMIQLRSKATVDTKKVTSSTKAKDKQKKKRAKNDNKNDAVTKAMMEMTRLEALIAKEREEYQKRPKRKFIGARAKEYRYALYVDKWRQKIETIGNENYPEAAKKLKLYGKLQMTVSIKKDGSIEKVELDRSSGHRVLDAAARHIVELGAPYDKFPENIRKETDILSITRTWSFTKESGMITQVE